MKLNLEKVLTICGEGIKKTFKELFETLERTKWPLYLTGASGTGKTLVAMNLAKKYSLKHDVPAYYVQLSPDQTKTSLILGLRLVNGSLVPVKGLVAKAMEEGGIVIVDEATHAAQEMLLMFNSICDRTAITSIGDAVILADESFRMIFCGNTSIYAGNIKLPQSFAQRVIAVSFDYPSLEEEIMIAKELLKSEYNGDIKVPKSVLKYICSIIREIRTVDYPLSVRNLAASCLILQVKYTCNKDGKDVDIDRLVNAAGGSEPEAVMRQLFIKLNNKEPKDTNEIIENKSISEFFNFIGVIGLNNFREAILQGLMYYLDVDGFGYDVQTLKDKLAASII